MSMTMRSIRVADKKPFRISVYYPQESTSHDAIKAAKRLLLEKLGENVSYSVLLSALSRFFVEHHHLFNPDKHIKL